MFLQLLLIIVFAFFSVFLQLLLIIIVTFIMLLLLLLIIIVILFCTFDHGPHILCFNYSHCIFHLDCGCYLLHPNYNCHLSILIVVITFSIVIVVVAIVVNHHHHLFLCSYSWSMPFFVFLQLLPSCLLPFFVHTLPHCGHGHSHHFLLCFYY